MKKFFKILLYVILGIILLIVGLVITINTPWGQNKIRAYAVEYLQKKLDTKVQIDSFSFSIPDNIHLGKVLILDKANDTLVWVDDLNIDMDMFKLLSNRISVDKLYLNDANINMYRTANDTNFNYQFIVDSFVSKQIDTIQNLNKEEAVALWIDVGDVNLTNTKFRFNDTIGGTLFGIKVNRLNLKPRKIDIDKLRFEVASFECDTANSYFVAIESKLPPSPLDTGTTDVTLVVDKLDLNKAYFVMNDVTSGLKFDIAAQKLSAAMPWFNLVEKKINIDYFNLENSDAHLVFEKIAKQANVKVVSNDTAQTDTDSSSWRLVVNDLLFKEIGFTYDDNNYAAKKSGMDYSHLNLYNFYLTAGNLLYSTDTISGIIKNLSTKEKSGLDVQTLRTVFTYHSKGAILDELYLKTPNTLLQDKMAINYRSLESLDKELGKANLDIAIKQSVVSFKDLFIFLPEEQKKQLRDYRNQSVNVSLLAKGPIERLELNQLFLKGLTRTAIDASGVLYGLPDPDKLSYNLNIKNLASSYNDIKAFVPKSVSDQVAIPAWFDMSGTISGNTQVYHPNLKIRTSDGIAIVKGDMDISRSGKEKYDLWVSTSGLNLGKILKMQDQIGVVNMSAKVKGVGFDPNTMNATIDGHIADAFLNGYRYHNVDVNGFLRNQVGEFALNSKDENAFMSMKAFLDLRDKYPAITSNLNIEYLNLKSLGLIDQDIVFTGEVQMNMPQLNIDYPQGEIYINNPFVTMNGTTYMLDSIYMISNPYSDSFQNIDLSIANIVKAKLSGHVPVTKMGDVILAHVNKYYQINDAKYTQPLGYDMNLSGTINYHKLFRKIVPELRPFDTVRFYALANPRDLNLGLTALRFRYEDMILDTLAFSAVEQDSSLSYVLSLNKFTKGEFEFYNSSIYGGVKENKISTFLNLADREQKEQFALGVFTELDPQSNMIFRMDDRLILNYDDWKVSRENRIKVGNGGFFVNSLMMYKGNESIYVKSDDTVFNSPFKVLIKNFTLANLTKMISKDTLIADGILNVDANVDLRGEYPKLVATAGIDSLQVMGTGFGNLAMQAQNESATVYNATMNLVGKGNDIGMSGYYYTKPVDGNELDFLAQVKSLSFKTIEGLSYGNLRNSSGQLWGNLNIKGMIEKPLVEGVLATDKLTTTLSMFNTYMNMPQEQIQFVPGVGLRVKNFNVFDHYGQKAILNGDIKTTNFIDYYLALRLNANRWEAMNSTSKDNDNYYGRMIVSAALGLKGDMTAPEIDGLITIHDSTDFHYAMLDNPELQSNEGIVSFYDSKALENMEDYGEKIKKAAYILSKSSALNVNIDIDKGAMFSVLIDPETGDELKVKGTAFLNANLGSDGNMALAGTYLLNDGTYDLNIEFIKKKFKIQQGSIIQLAGDPMDAEANITAVYEKELEPYDLMQSNTVDQSIITYAKQAIPFKVLLKMSGPVLKPNISFDITADDADLNSLQSNVKSFMEAKLNEFRNSPSDMNKQVVAILALNRFVSEDVFSTVGSNLGIENAVRQSASRFLSGQLNRMAGDLIKGLDLDFGVNSSEDYSTGSKMQRTDLSISASKRLLNDRLNITIGNDFSLGGQNTVQNPSYLPGNISLDYMITPDGRYVVRGYRKAELQNFSSGYNIETGVGFRFGLEYNKFRQLWMGEEKYRAYMRKKREEERKKEAEKQAQQIPSVGILAEPFKLNFIH